MRVHKDRSILARDDVRADPQLAVGRGLPHVAPARAAPSARVVDRIIQLRLARGRVCQ